MATALAFGLAALAAGGPAAAPSGGQADLHRDFTGVVAAVESGGHTFAVRTSSRYVTRFVADDRTRWSQSCHGVACVRVGHRLVVHARPAGTHWVALAVVPHFVQVGGRVEGQAWR